MSKPERRAGLAGLACLLVLCSSCRRRTDDWVAEFVAGDAWHRRMAALAMRSVPDEEVALAFRTLLLQLKDREPEVLEALQDTLLQLSLRNPKLPRRAIDALPESKLNTRMVMANILLELARRGDSEARTALEAYLAVEEASGVDLHRTAAAELRRALAQ